MKGRKCPNRQDHGWVLSLSAPSVAPTFGLSLTRSPLSYPVPPPAAVSSSSMWDSATGFSRDSSAWLPTEGRQPGRGGQR